MYSENRTQIYIDSIAQPLPPYLEKLRGMAVSNDVPVIRRQTEELLSFFLADIKPKRLLEVGTAIGYSAIFMSEYGPAGLMIDTIERSKNWAALALSNISGAGKESCINLIEGDAADILPTLEGPYDMIFMDAAKGQYLSFLPEIERLLSKGGLLISDNVLQDGDIIKPRTSIPRRDRTIHSRMREYLYTLTHSDSWQSLILPLADGTCVSIKK